MNNTNNANIRIQSSIVIYLIFIGSVIYIKPKHMYNNNGTLKQFGTGSNNTLFPLWFIIFIGAFISYYLTHIILFIMNKKI